MSVAITNDIKIDGRIRTQTLQISNSATLNTRVFEILYLTFDLLSPCTLKLNIFYICCHNELSNYPTEDANKV